MNFKHGLAGTPDYITWRHMIKRCTDPAEPRYERYGGRGITVCDAWQQSLLQFKIDMGPRPTPQHTLERKDNDGNYEPGNCRWATRQEQAMNRGGRRATLRLTWQGETRTLMEWATHLNLPYKFLRNRYTKGWSTQRILTEPYHAIRHTHD